VRVFVRLLRFARRSWPHLLLAAFLAGVGATIEVLRPWPVKIVVDHVLGTRALPPGLAAAAERLPGAEQPQGLLLWSVLALLAITITASLLTLFVLMLVVRIAQSMVYELSLQLFGKLQRLSLAYHGRHAVGDLMQRMSTDVFVAHFTISQIALPGGVAVLTLGGMAVVMFRLDPVLAAIALSTVLGMALIYAGFNQPLNRTTSNLHRVQGNVMAFLEQSLSAIRIIQGFGREALVQEQLRHRARELGDAYNASTGVSARYKEAVAVLTGVVGAVILGLGGLRVLDGGLSLGALLIFLGYLTALNGPVTSLATAIGASVVVASRGRRIFEVLDSGEEVRERAQATRLERVAGAVQFEQVTFGYGDPASSEPVLRDVSFAVAPGQVTAIVGATGAGKTSLVGLLSRFHDPWAGRILLDGLDLRDVTIASLREQVSLVLQDPFIFPMSIADNIAFGRPGASRDAIVAAAMAAQAHRFIERLPQGYETLVGERGGTLSGGEKQRIAIARALLKDAPVLVLDEPTSALDARTEGHIIEAMTRLLRDRTTFIISHRLSTIRRAHQIIVLEDGSVVEQGTHDSLLAAGQAYARLYRHQDRVSL
jgi:ATP-binding cassette subfamily B protein/subfamily B ATP-binding cassette protein MsbA